MFKKKLGFLLGVMVLLSLAGYLVCRFAGNGKQLNNDDKFLLVTSFYPMYILAENLTEGMEGVEVLNLTQNQTGCLHDYQLTSGDMKLLAKADAFLINGAGMELFTEKVLENQKELPVIEASGGIDLLEGTAHSHEHGEEEEHEDHLHAENGHVWMDVSRYLMQAENVKKALQKLLPEQTEALNAAAAAYEEKLDKLSEKVRLLIKDTEHEPVILFHEAFAYLAESLHMEVLMTFSLDEDSVPSAGEIAEAIEELKFHGGGTILIEEEYAAYADKIVAETGAAVVFLNPLTGGDGSKDSYCKEMQKNLDALENAFLR